LLGVRDDGTIASFVVGVGGGVGAEEGGGGGVGGGGGGGLGAKRNLEKQNTDFCFVF